WRASLSGHSWWRGRARSRWSAPPRPRDGHRDRATRARRAPCPSPGAPCRAPARRFSRFWRSILVNVTLEALGELETASALVLVVGRIGAKRARASGERRARSRRRAENGVGR